MPTFEHNSDLPYSADTVYAWHARPGAFLRLAPPWESVRLLTPDTGIAEGAKVVLEVGLDPLGLIRREWDAVLEDVTPGTHFVDRQRSGPFAAWRHTHQMTPLSPERCRLTDRIVYRLSYNALGPIGCLLDTVAAPFVTAKLRRMFRHRHAVTVADLKAHARFRGDQPLKILVSGASGLVGSALVPFLQSGGHHVVRLVRRRNAGTDEIAWNPAKGQLDTAALEGFDAVINLSGENIAEGRWTEAKKAAIRDSRIQSTQLLAETMAKLEQPPKVFVNASAIGYYGNTGEVVQTETSPGGFDFLGLVCRNWEKATDPARDKGIRTVLMRFGVILSPKGGALAKMLPIFQLGGGGPLGNGKQWMSWIALDDVVGALHHALITEGLRGPVNVVAPNPVRNKEYSHTLGKVLFRPAFAPVPSLAVKAMFGEMGDALLLSSTRVEPIRLQETGYEFRYPQLEGALRHLLGK